MRDYFVNPKTKIRRWKSMRYRKFLRDNFLCAACGQPLNLEKENFETHHLDAEGGKNPADQNLCPICLFCHNYLELNEGEFMRVNGLSEEGLKDQAITCMALYLSNLTDQDATLDFLTEVASIKEGIN